MFKYIFLTIITQMIDHNEWVSNDLIDEYNLKIAEATGEIIIDREDLIIKLDKNDDRNFNMVRYHHIGHAGIAYHNSFDWIAPVAYNFRIKLLLKLLPNQPVKGDLDKEVHWQFRKEGGRLLVFANIPELDRIKDFFVVPAQKTRVRTAYLLLIKLYKYLYEGETG